MSGFTPTASSWSDIAFKIVCHCVAKNSQVNCRPPNAPLWCFARQSPPLSFPSVAPVAIRGGGGGGGADLGGITDGGVLTGIRVVVFVDGAEAVELDDVVGTFASLAPASLALLVVPSSTVLDDGEPDGGDSSDEESAWSAEDEAGCGDSVEDGTDAEPLTFAVYSFNHITSPSLMGFPASRRCRKRYARRRSLPSTGAPEFCIRDRVGDTGHFVKDSVPIVPGVASTRWECPHMLSLPKQSAACRCCLTESHHSSVL